MSTPSPTIQAENIPQNIPSDWRDLAECLDADPARFDPPIGRVPRKWELDAADATIRSYCVPCQVRLQCRAMAISKHSVGIWGGELRCEGVGNPASVKPIIHVWHAA